MTSSSVCGLDSCRLWSTVRPYGTIQLAKRRQDLRFCRESSNVPLAILHSIADFLRVLGGQLAHFRNDLPRALLEVDHAVDELLDRIGADRGAVPSPDRLLLDLFPDLGQILEALRHAFLHRIEGLGGLVKPEDAGEGGFESGQDAVVGGKEGYGLAINPLFSRRRLHEPAHDYLGRIVC